MALPPLAPLEMSLRASDGLILKGTLHYPPGSAGRPAPLAVLAHQYPATRDSFAPLVHDLLERGIAALAFDQRGHGASTEGPHGPVVIESPADFEEFAFYHAFVGSITGVGFYRIDDDIVRAAAWGAAQNFIDTTRLALVGASVGGSGVLLASPRVHGLRAVATVGAAGAPAFGEDAPQRIRAALETVRVPAYLASSREDPFDGAANAASWSEGLDHVASRIVDGPAHAMAIYFDVRDELLAFLEANLSFRS